MGWAAVATTLGCILEVPLDKSKLSMTGGGKMAAAAALIRVPLGSMLLGVNIFFHDFSAKQS